MPSFTSADPAAYIALAMQSAFGTAQTTPAKFRFAKYITGNNVAIVPAVVDLREGGDGLDFGTTYKQQVKVQGNLRWNARPEFTGQALQLIIGGATWNGASQPANHLFHTNHASYPYGTLIAAHPGTSLIHFLRDVRLTGLSLEMRTGQPWAFSAPFTSIGVGASHGIALVPSYPTGDDFFLYTSGSYLKDGTADTTIESITIDLALGVEELQAQGLGLDDIVVQNRDVNVTFVRRYQNSGDYAAVHFGASGNLSPTTTVAAGSLFARQDYGSGAAARFLQLNMGNLSYRNDAISEMDPNGQTVRETFTAKGLKTASSILNFTLGNAHASAYAG
jgi:hypothetical protein